MRYPLIAVLPASTDLTDLDNILADVMAPFDENREDTPGLPDDQPLTWDRYAIGDRFSGFFPVRPGADRADLIHPHSADGADPHDAVCDGGRIRALDLERKRANAARHLKTSSAKAPASSADHSWAALAQRARDTAIPTGAVLTHEGVWLSPGGVRFVTERTGPAYDAFVALANAYLNSLDDDTILVLVDCHT